MRHQIGAANIGSQPVVMDDSDAEQEPAHEHVQALHERLSDTRRAEQA
jgi:hypothetical protein